MRGSPAIGVVPSIRVFAGMYADCGRCLIVDGRRMYWLFGSDIRTFSSSFKISSNASTTLTCSLSKSLLTVSSSESDSDRIIVYRADRRFAFNRGRATVPRLNDWARVDPREHLRQMDRFKLAPLPSWHVASRGRARRVLVQLGTSSSSFFNSTSASNGFTTSRRHRITANSCSS